METYTENKIILNKHTFIYIKEQKQYIEYIYENELETILNNFCGNVMIYETFDDFNNDIINYNIDSVIYLTGDIEKNYYLLGKYLVYIVKEFSYNYDNNYNLIEIGHVPLNIANIGIFYRKLFDTNINYFKLIENEHTFQTLTESNKQAHANRKGILLSKVNKVNDEIQFNMLRCSTNFEGPTENFKKVDYEIINKINNICNSHFETSVELNHVLAQIYYNKVDENNKNKKAAIKAHSDKTKDMPLNGVMVFTSFYDFDVNSVNYKCDGLFDIIYKNTSVLTKLNFKLKNNINDPNYIKDISITLYPNSVFIIPLSTNRLYTHEIKPSTLPCNIIPLRMGYVIKCSKTKGIYKNGETFIFDNNKLVKLNDMTFEDIKKIKDLYYLENTSSQIIDYGNIDFSMNSGDFIEPHY
jgi:hypothetical protein